MKYPPIIFAILTALCWGLYGPVLAKSRMFLQSPFKPYVAIGVAYLVWGILGGVIGMKVKGEEFSFGGAGVGWGFAAGTLGAWGALALTLAMFTGGQTAPHVVMSIVFGGAVTVSALYSVSMGGGHGVKPQLYVGIVGILVSAIIVAYYSPHAPTKPAGTPEKAATEAK